METDALSEKFIRRYATEADAVLRFCYYRTSDKDVAMDLMQDTFMRFWVALNREEGEVQNERALLFAIARNSIIDWYRKKKSLSLDALIEESGPDGELFADWTQKEAMETSHDARRILDKIWLLDPIYQQVVRYRFVEDLRPKEIAGRLGASSNMVSVRLYRGVRQLRKLAGYVYFISPGRRIS